MTSPTLREALERTEDPWLPIDSHQRLEELQEAVRRYLATTSHEAGRRAGLEEAARVAALFIINGNSIHPDIPADQMSTNAKMIAHTTCQYVSDAIRNLAGDEGIGDG